MSDMSKAESAERLREGLKQAASHARDLAKLEETNQWSRVAQMFDALRETCEKMIFSKALTDAHVAAICDQRIAKQKMLAGNNG